MRTARCQLKPSAPDEFRAGVTEHSKLSTQRAAEVHCRCPVRRDKGMEREVVLSELCPGCFHDYWVGEEAVTEW